jgi:acyl-CoA oxidase
MMAEMGRKALRFFSYHNEFPLTAKSEVIKTLLLNYQTPLSLHNQMFLTTLDNLCDEEQRSQFLEPARRGEILGCYAQTELGHGSDIQRLESTATFDAATDSFVINSPTIASAKWWIGDLGMYCTHAAFFAQLIINNKKHGLHAFLVPIRDPKTYQPLPEVEVGDIGPKQGFNTKDNGYCLIKNLRIPRRNMLMKYHTVSKDGQYAVQGNEKISYATMLVTRSAITINLGNQYAKIAIIATRYSLLRRQFKDEKGEEIPILNYQTQQTKVLSRIGEVYACIATAKAIKELSDFVYSEAKEGRFTRLNEAHTLTSAAKAYLSCEVQNNIEVARRSAGGHGFHLYSGMIGVQQELSPIVTLEGTYPLIQASTPSSCSKSHASSSRLSPDSKEEPRWPPVSSTSLSSARETCRSRFMSEP